jgi:flagellar biosynthesis GTPase FlhF
MTPNTATAQPEQSTEDTPREGTKIYRGRSIAELLPQVRDELGPDAVVLRQREGRTGGLGGFFAQRYVEIEAIAATPHIDLYDGGDMDVYGAASRGDDTAQGAGLARGFEAVAARPAERLVAPSRAPQSLVEAAAMIESAATVAAVPPMAPAPPIAPPVLTAPEPLMASEPQPAIASEPISQPAPIMVAEATPIMAIAESESSASEPEPATAPVPAPAEAPPTITPAEQADEIAAQPPVWPSLPELQAPEVEPTVARTPHLAVEPDSTIEESPADGEPAPASFAQALAAAAEQPLAQESAEVAAEESSREELAQTASTQQSEAPTEPAVDATAAQIAAMEEMLAQTASEPELTELAQPLPAIELIVAQQQDGAGAEQALAAERDVLLAGREAMVADREAMVADREAMVAERETMVGQVEPASVATEADGETTPAMAETMAGPIDPIGVSMPQAPAPEPIAAPAPAEALTMVTPELAEPAVALAEPVAAPQPIQTPLAPPPPQPIRPALGAGELELSEELVAAGMSETLARRLVSQALAHHLPLVPGGALRDAVRAELARSLPQFPSLPPAGAMVALVGPGGSGKTRVAAALAASYRSSSALSVRAMTLGGPQSLTPLAGLLAPHGVAVAAQSPGAECGESSQQRSGVLVVLDTESVSPRDPHGIAQLQAELAARAPDAVLLTMPATIAVSAARALLEALDPLEPSAIVVTHADELDQIGGAIEIAIRSGMPIAYIHDGLELPGALRRADPADLAAAILP